MSKHARIICFIIWAFLITVGVFVGLAIKNTNWLYNWGFFIVTFSFIFITLALEGGRKR